MLGGGQKINKTKINGLYLVQTYDGMAVWWASLLPSRTFGGMVKMWENVHSTSKANGIKARK